MKKLRALIIIIGATIFASMPVQAKESPADNYKNSSQNWPMPLSGPKASKGKKILYVAMDLTNGGILGVAEGLEEAAKEINWQLIIRNASGDNAKVEDILKNALKQNLDGLIIGGFNAVNFNKELQALSQQNIKIIGWHSGATPGPLKGTPVLTNITTEPDQVAKYAAGEVINEISKKAGVIIFTDSNYEIALKKSGVMENEIRQCAHCELLEVIDLSLSEETPLAQKKIKQLLDKYGSRWTHSLAINDRYYDFAVPVFAIYEKEFPLQIKNISAGDGSYSAYLRIKYGGLQYATIPEPLLLQGWQLIDELNRLFNAKPPSSYKNILKEINKNNLFDPQNNYRQTYINSWESDN
jgi:ribose transport system substrate-binding protein